MKKITGLILFLISLSLYSQGIFYVPQTTVTLTTLTASTSLTASYATASTMAIFDANKNLITATTATYPSLTELSYVKGLTSAVQTQINAKASLSGATFTGTQDFSGVTILIIGGTAPVSASSTGVAGEIRIAEDTGQWYIYKCIATDNWIRLGPFTTW